MINFRDLYESYASEVYRFSFWLAGDSPEAEDITSETFIRAWAHNGKIRTETLKAYLFTICRNVYLERQRKRKKQVVLTDVYPDPAPGPGVPDVRDDRLPPWRENGLKKQALATEMTTSP
jgi:RNA polymerase sigma factor (sigma-70 family)